MASGQGSNAQAIMDYFSDRPGVSVSLVLSNNKNANVLTIARDYGIKTVSFNRNEFYQSDKILDLLVGEAPDLIVLAGFMWKVPEKFLLAFPRKIINIHPALLPKYGGKGMYGKRVHRAVLANGEKKSGISIHYCNADYDKGKLIDQFKTPVAVEDDVASLSTKIKTLEHRNYAKVIDQLLFSKS